jgi:hypothetical protein
MRAAVEENRRRKWKSMAKANTARSKLESALEDLGSEERRLNRDIDQVNAEIKANNLKHNSEAEIATAVRETIHTGADRYRDHLKFPLRDRDLRQIDLMPIQPIDYRAGLMPTQPNVGLLKDGFYFLLENIPGAIDSIIAMAPKGGVTKEQREQIDATLRAKKLALETELEALYQGMEKAGFQPRRRPDLSPRVFLNFVDKENWSKGKLEAQRQRCGEIRSAQSKLTTRRSEVLQERGKLESLSDDNDPRLKSNVEGLKAEETSLNERIEANRQEVKRSDQLFNLCLVFLRDHGVSVDVHV